MWSRLTFLFVTVFWVVMNFLLWRSEFGGRNELPSAVPVEKVLEKVLTAPDPSALNIYHHGKKIGYCKWSANVAQNAADASVNADEFEPEGMIKSPSSYDLELEGNLFIAPVTNNARFNLNLSLSTNRAWKEFFIHVSMRPNSWDIQASAQTQKLELTVEDETGRSQETYKFADLQKPEFLMNQFAGPMGWVLLAGLGPSTKTNSLEKLSLGLNWKAHNDWMRFGHSKVRVYKLETKVLDRYEIFIFVSRVGEILWVHLPDDVVLSNDAFTLF